MSGFFAFTKGMPVMFLQNTNTSAGLVNGMVGSVEEVILDRDVRGMRKALFYNY
jgi:ATP-dependent exoDNAse (exonuclease V) alpha subunit